MLGVALGLVSSSADARGRRTRRSLAWLLRAARRDHAGYVSFFRGTPLFVQILLVHFALMPALIHPDSGLLLSRRGGAHASARSTARSSRASLALTLNAGAYICEIFRAGIQSIHRGQTQAGLQRRPDARARRCATSCCRRRSAAWCRRWSTKAITLIKDSSLVSAIGLAELALAARTVAGAYSRYWEPYLAISAMYLVLTLVLSTLAKRLEAPAHLRGR